MGFFTDVQRESIRQSKFQLDCLKMTLSRQASGKLTYEGAGQIRQNAEGALDFVLYDTNSETDPDDFFKSKPVGTFLDDDELFKLEAEETNGEIWTAEWVHIARSLPAERIGAVVRGQLTQITSRAPWRDDVAAFVGYIPRALRIPLNHITETTISRAWGESRGSHMDSWVAELEGIGKLSVRQVEAGLDVHLDSSKPAFPAQWDVRFEEAMSFVLGQPFKWLEFQVLTDGELRRVVRTPATSRRKPRLQPPVRMRPLQREPAELLTKYLQYLTDTPPTEDRYHPLAVSLARVYRASASDIEDEALVLAIEVERLLREHHERRVPIPTTLREAVTKAKSDVKEWGPEIRDRLVGALDSFLVPSAASILNALQSEGVLELRHARAWKVARNRETHGRRGSQAIEDLAGECDVVHQALLLIVFHIIGYDGRFSDYTKRGWPTIGQPRILRTTGEPEQPHSSESS